MIFLIRESEVFIFSGNYGGLSGQNRQAWQVLIVALLGGLLAGFSRFMEQLFQQLDTVEMGNQQIKDGTDNDTEDHVAEKERLPDVRKNIAEPLL
jgi:predicted kinase